MGDALCIHSKTCGIFMNCTLKQLAECSGPVEQTEQSRINLLKAMGLKDGHEGKCTICGELTDVYPINEYANGCLNCWVDTIQPRRELHAH